VKSTASFESLDNQRTTQINSPAATRIGDAFLLFLAGHGHTPVMR
jgi:hypothetical protein